MSIGNFDANSVGGWGASGMGAGNFGNFGGGIGAFGLFGLLGIDSLGNRKHDDGDGCGKQAALLAAIANTKDAAVAEGRGVLAAIVNAKDTTVAEGRALTAAVAANREASAAQAYAAAIQAANNTQAIQNQASAIAVVNDKRFDDLALAGVQQTAAILARINQSEVDALRDQLHNERRRGDSKDIEITMIQNQNQLQAQAQVQNFDIHRKFDALFNQQAKSGQDIIAVGSLLAGTTQTANPVNVKS